MSASPQLTQKLKTLLTIWIISILAGIIFQYFDDGFVDHNAFFMGTLIGLGFGLYELYFISKVKRKIKSYALPIIILINVFLYTLLVFIISAVGGLVGGALSNKSLSEYYDYLTGVEQFYLIGYSIIVFTFIILFLQINRLLGKGVLIKLLLARYRKPVEEERIIMFLDLTSSSEIAERLNPQDYSSFIKDFFLDLDDAIIETKGYVFQYVGDEVVILWDPKEGAENNNCTKLFFYAKDKILEKKDYYTNKYGIIPQFKAGIHYGKVVVSEIGGTKQEIAYHGDTINTAARIRSTCHTLNSELLISAELLSLLHNIDVEFDVNSVGISNFKGKKNVIGLFSISENNNSTSKIL